MSLMIMTLALIASIISAISATPTSLPIDLCSTPECNAAAKFIRDSMNESINPCENFYEYSCGGWMAEHTIEASKTHSGIFDDLSENLYKNILKELKSLNVSNPKHSLSVRYSAHLFHKCLDVANQREDAGWHSIKEVYTSIFKQIQNITWGSLLSHVWSQTSLSPIFLFSLGQDPKNNVKNVITIDPGSLGIGEMELANPEENKELIDAYKKYIFTVAKDICYKLEDKSKCTIDNLNKDADAIINLETELSRIRLSPEDRRNPELVYNKFNLEELKNKTNFDWLPFFEESFQLMKTTKEVKNLEVLVSDVNYIVKAIEILKKADKRTLLSYFGWKVTSSFGPYASEQFRKIKFSFDKVYEGIKEMETREKFCYELNYMTQDYALSRLYVDKHFSKQEKQVATKLIKTIQASYNDIIKNNDWLDQITIKKSIEKLQKITINVAYPEWLLEDSELDEYYNMNETFYQELIDMKEYLVALVVFTTVQNKQKIDDFDKVLEKEKSWPMPPAMVNAAYEPLQNSITIPAAILKSPFFDFKRPYPINYGFIGVVVGHEFTHGFDDQGSQFDLSGNQKNWWTDIARKGYEKRAQCFVDEYSAQVDKLTGLHLNGKNTLGENIADNGGLKESYNAFKVREQVEGKSLVLANLPQFDSDKLFFISFAQTWCSLTRLEEMKSLILYNEHSPAKQRVEVPTYNNEAFHKAFKCPEKKSQKECSLW